MTNSWNRNFIFFHKLRWDICDVWNILVSAKCKSHTIYKMVERLYGSKSQWKYLTLVLFIDQPKKPRLMKLYCNCSSNIFTKGLKEKKLHYFFFLCILLNLSGENCIWEFSSLDYWPHMVMMILQTFIWISHQALELLLSFSFRNSCWLF